MKDRIFDRPIFVKNGKFKTEISGLTDALNFLEEWPKSRRGQFTTQLLVLANGLPVVKYMRQLLTMRSPALPNRPRFLRTSRRRSLSEKILKGTWAM